MQRLESELKGVRTRGFNYEHPLVFAAVILSMAENDRSPKDIHSRIDHRMDLWDHIRFASLVENTVNAGGGGGGDPGGVCGDIRGACGSGI